MPGMDDLQVLNLKCYECKEERIDCPDWAKWFLLSLIAYLGMTPLENAHWEAATPPGGCASRGMLESDVSVHTWPEVEEVLVSIKCCAPFDEDNAMSWIRATLRSHRVVRA